MSQVCLAWLFSMSLLPSRPPLVPPPPNPEPCHLVQSSTFVVIISSPPPLYTEWFPQGVRAREMDFQVLLKAERFVNKGLIFLCSYNIPFVILIA